MEPENSTFGLMLLVLYIFAFCALFSLSSIEAELQRRRIRQCWFLFLSVVSTTFVLYIFSVIAGGMVGILPSELELISKEQGTALLFVSLGAAILMTVVSRLLIRWFIVLREPV